MDAILFGTEFKKKMYNVLNKKIIQLEREKSRENKLSEKKHVDFY